MVPGERYRREILEQPAILEALLREQRAHIEGIAAEIRRGKPTYGLLAARGSSDNAARYAQYVLGVRNQLTCGLATPSVFTGYGATPNLQGSLTIGLSQSGQSPDVVEVVAAAARQGALTIALTNDEGSPLAQVAGMLIDVRAGRETAIPATKTVTSQLMAVAMLSSALRSSELDWETLQLIPEAVQSTLDLNSALGGVENFADIKHLVVLGRGYNYASAFEIALKISETSAVLALPFSVADFFHGPIASLGPETTVVLVVPSGIFDEQIPTLLGVLEKSKARLIVISDNEQLLGLAEVALSLPPTPEWVSPICAIVAGQLFSAALASIKLQDPDEPRGLRKITLTY